MVMIVWLLDLQLPVQSVPITTKVLSSNPVHREVNSIQHYVIKFVSDFVHFHYFWCQGQFDMTWMLRLHPPIRHLNGLVYGV
jgi:hypothetical protein